MKSATEGTILQKKLTEIAAYIGYFGLVVGVLTTVTLTISYFIREPKPLILGEVLTNLVEFISIGQLGYTLL